MDDRELFHAGYNRVYDSLEPETNLDHVEEVMDHISTHGTGDIACSWKFTGASANSHKTCRAGNSEVRV